MIPANKKEGALEFSSDDRDRSQIAEERESQRADGEDVPAYYKRRSAGVWACLAALTVILAVVVLYGYAILKQESIQLEQIPGMSRSLSAIGQHVGNVERRLADSRADQQKLALQVQSVNAGSQAGLELSRQQANNLIVHAQETFLKNLNQQTSAFKAQVSQLVSERTTDRARLTQVEEQLAQARNELETTRTEYARQVEALREQQGEEHRELASLSSSLPTRQVTFKIPENQRAEVTPGVSVQVTKIDVRRQRFDGWIESAPGNQKVRIQSQGVRNPVVFYPEEHGKLFVMVVTSLEQKGAGGYLLMPTGSGTVTAANFISSAESPASLKEVPSGRGNTGTAP